MKVLIIGEKCIDRYIYGNCYRLSPEGPVPVLLYNDIKISDGMSGNVFNNFQSIWHGDKINANKISSTALISNDEDMFKTRYIDKKTNQLLLRVDKSDRCRRIKNDMLETIVSDKYDYIIVSDYNKGFLTEEDLCILGKSSNVFSILDSKRKLNNDIAESYKFIKLNTFEANQNLDIIQTYVNKILITHGPDGVEYDFDIFPVPSKIQTFDVSGAGDTFVAAFSYAMIINNNINDAIVFAQTCCSQVIQKQGTAVYEW